MNPAIGEWKLMRHVVITLAMLSVPAAGAAQETQTLLGSDIRHGGFAGPVVKFTEIDGQFGVLVGGRGGWIINDSFVIGAGGYGLANEDQFDDYIDVRGDALRLIMGYGGLELEYINQPHEIAHVSLAVLVGAGGTVWEANRSHRDRDEDIDAFFITEPALNVMLNVSEHFRIGFGASYRFVEDVELPGLRAEDISGPAGVLTFKFGGF